MFSSMEIKTSTYYFLPDRFYNENQHSSVILIYIIYIYIPLYVFIYFWFFESQSMEKLNRFVKLFVVFHNLNRCNPLKLVRATGISIKQFGINDLDTFFIRGVHILSANWSEWICHTRSLRESFMNAGQSSLFLLMVCMFS